MSKGLLDFYKLRDTLIMEGYNYPSTLEIMGNVEKELKALEIIKEWFDFDFAIRYGDNQPMIKITNKRNGKYWELPETTEICDLLKEVLM